jgi:hypothetical protein
MKKEFLIVLLLIAENLFSQQNSERYQFSLQKADYFSHQGKFDSAFNLYKVVVKEKNKSAFDCVSAGKAGLKTHHLDFAKKCFDEALSLGYSISFIQNSLDSTVPASFIKSFFHDTAYYMREFSMGANLILKGKIDSAFMLDQRVRDIEDYDSIHIVDSSNAFFLRNILMTVGFPSEKMIGCNSKSDFGLMLEHVYWVLLKSDSSLITTLLLQQIKEDNYLLPDYAYLMERYNIVYGRQQEWGLVPWYITKDINDPKSIRDIANVDYRRKQMLLIPLKYETRIKKEDLPQEYKIYDYTEF